MRLLGSGAGIKVSLLIGYTTGDFNDAKVTRKFDDVPDDPSAL
jgi:hypothetical protein